MDVLPGQPPVHSLDDAVVAFVSEVSTPASRRKQRLARRQERLYKFLEAHRFSRDLSEPRQPTGCFRWAKEVIYPIHAAAALGDGEVVRMILAAQADPSQRSSRGRTALQIAKEKDNAGSHANVLALLQGEVRVVALRHAKEL